MKKQEEEKLFDFNIIFSFFREPIIKAFMKQTKKQVWIKENWRLIRALLIFIPIFTILFFGYWIFIHSTSYICSKNPEKCVCEEYKGGFKAVTNKFYNDWQKCIKLRLKTQAELDIDYCNNNPREDDDCKCEEYLYREGTPPCVVSDDFENPCIQSRPKTDWEKHPELYKCILWRLKFYSGFNKTNHTYYYTNEALESQTNQDFLDDIKNKECTKWRNLTECEKGNPDYISKIENIDTSHSLHPTCILKKGYFCPFLDGEHYIENITNYVGCEYKALCQVTICREKTDDEKCVDHYQQIYSCDEIEFWMKRCIARNCRESECGNATSKEDIIYKNLKQAWRQKGCKI